MIRRVLIDAQNGRSRTTLAAHMREVLRTAKDCSLLGKTPSYVGKPRGPMPIEDTFGMSLAVEMVNRSLVAKGRINKGGFIQWESLRKMRSSATRVYEASIYGVNEMNSFSKGTGRIKLTTCPTQSDGFTLFTIGAEKRMGHESEADRPLHINAVLRLLELIKRDASREPPVIANELWKAEAVIAVGLMGSLRGPEIYMLDLAGTRRYLAVGKQGILPRDPLKEGVDLFNAPHVVLCLLGNFKGETGACEHMLAVTSTSRSGVDVRWWVEKLVEVRLSEGCTHGPAFGKPDGTLVSTLDMNSILHHYLHEILREDNDLILPSDDVIKNYSNDRTWRKTAQGRARAAGLKGDVQDAMNRWFKVERAGTRRPRFNMRDHYSNVRDLMPVTWRYAYVQ